MKNITGPHRIDHLHLIGGECEKPFLSHAQAAFASLGEYHDIRPLFSEAAAVRFIIFIPEQGFVVEFRSYHNIYQAERLFIAGRIIIRIHHYGGPGAFRPLYGFQCGFIYLGNIKICGILQIVVGQLLHLHKTDRRFTGIIQDTASHAFFITDNHVEKCGFLFSFY